MAPTVWLQDTPRRRPYSLEEHFSTITISPYDGVRRGSLKKNVRLQKLNWNNKVVMGLVVEQEVRESEGLPPCGATHKQGLIELTLRTMALVRRNQLLQKRLTALQLETRALVKSFLERADPETDSPSSPL